MTPTTMTNKRRNSSVPASEVSANTEEYLEWIYRLSKENDEVTTTDLARKLKVSPASVTGMLKRLAERELIDYQPYKGIALTPGGRTVAARIIRRHGLIERLLFNVLGLPWHEVDAVAGRIEHVITDEVEERIAQLCGYPTTCPHGQPIDMEAPDFSVRLTTLDAGEEARVSRIGDEEPEFLSYVEELGLRPGVHLTSLGRAPFNGPVRIRVSDREHALGDEVAAEIWVERLASAPSAGAPEPATAGSASSL
jgi:DtxR family transcriptional regulator, Mn-dependent transcriptional regulator